jgi:hypothetical protein
MQNPSKQDWSADTVVQGHWHHQSTALLWNPAKSRYRVPPCSRGVSSCSTTTPVAARDTLHSCTASCWSIPHTSRTYHPVTSTCSDPEENAEGRRIESGKDGSSRWWSHSSSSRGSISWYISGMPASTTNGEYFYWSLLLRPEQSPNLFIWTSLIEVMLCIISRSIKNFIDE